MRALEQQSIVRLTYAGRERERARGEERKKRDTTAVTYLVLRSTVHTPAHDRTYLSLATYLYTHTHTDNSPSAPLQLQVCKRPTVTRRPGHARQLRHVGLPEREVSRV